MSSQNTEKIHRSQGEELVLKMTGDPILKKMLDEERVEGRLLDTALLKRLFGFLAPHKTLTAMVVALAFVESLVATGPAFFIGAAMDRAMNSPRTESGLLAWIDHVGAPLVEQWGEGSSDAASWVVFYGLVVGLVYVSYWVVSMVAFYSMQRLGQVVVHDLRVEVFQHISSMDLGFFHKNPVGRLVNRTTFDVQAVSELFADAFAQGFRDFLFILVLLGVMFAMDAPLALILLGAFPFLVGVALLYRRLARPALRTNSAVSSRMNAWMAENIAGMRENQLYRREKYRRAEFDALTRAHQSSIADVIHSWAILRPGMMMTCGVATTLILWLGYDRATSGVITVGVLLTFLQYTVRVWRPVRSLTEKFNLIQSSLTSAERIMDVLDARTGIKDPVHAPKDQKVTRGELRFDKVRFAYPGTEEEVLKGVDFHIQPGQMLALVGDTGAGKSTIVHLMSRFYDVTSGRVEIDGEDVKSYLLRNLRSGIAIVPQDLVIFAGSIRENITLGAEVSEDRIIQCAKAVCADKFIHRLGGLDATLDEGGKTLSVGERQLLSFARALVANPPVLILDEATANVDTRTEVQIQKALEALTEGRTCVAIAHRLSTIRNADLILLLRHGQVVERGSHPELMDMDGEYAKLVRLHMRSESEDR